MYCIMKYIVWAEISFRFSSPVVLHCAIQKGGRGGGEYFVLQRDNYYRRNMLLAFAVYWWCGWWCWWKEGRTYNECNIFDRKGFGLYAHSCFTSSSRERLRVWRSLHTVVYIFQTFLNDQLRQLPSQGILSHPKCMLQKFLQRSCAVDGFIYI